MTRLQNAIINIVREWTGARDLSLLPMDHPAKFFVEKSLEDMKVKEYTDLIKMLNVIKKVYQKELVKVLPDAKEEKDDLKEYKIYLSDLESKVEYMKRFRYGFLVAEILEIKRVIEKIKKKYSKELKIHGGFVRTRYLIYITLLCILVATIFFQLREQRIKNRDTERQKNIDKVMVAMGKYYFDQRDNNSGSNPAYPHIPNRKGGWDELEKYLSPFIEDFPKESVDETDIPYYYYASNGFPIGTPGICFILEVLLDNKDTLSTYDETFTDDNCDEDINSFCFFRSGVYQGIDGRLYGRFVGGGC